MEEIQKTEIHTEKDESKNELKNEVNVEPFSTPAEKKVVKIELFEYDIDDSQIEDEEIENQLLQRTMSLTDLSISKPIENSEQNDDTSKLIPLAKSTSLTNLSKPNLADLNPESEFLKSAVDALEEHRQEQAAIEKQIQNLMEASLKRREQFRAVWGVSPKSINQKRDLKTVLNVQKVAFSSDLIENDNVIENENDLEQNDMFGMNTITDEEKNEENEQEKAPIGNFYHTVWKFQDFFCHSDFP